MGVERAVTRWYIQRQPILQEIATLQAQLDQLAQLQQSEQTGATTPLSQTASDLAQRLANAQQKLYTLGPCPKPMMG